MFLLAIAIEKVHLIVICFVPGFVYLKHKQISSNKSLTNQLDRADNILFTIMTDSQENIYPI